MVVGRVNFLEDGDHIDCTRMGVGGKAIPALVHKITDIKSDAKFILLVEKDAAFMRLAEDRFYNKFPCIVGHRPHQPPLLSIFGVIDERALCGFDWAFTFRLLTDWNADIDF